MTLPIVAVVGRPNVGKSTFVNRITQQSDAIVHEQRGVTRDRSYHTGDWNGIYFTLIDTGGIESGRDDRFQGSIRSQAYLATEQADAIVFLVDAKTGIVPDDLEIARRLQKSATPVFLAVNKMDTPGREDEMWEFYGLGLGDPWPISATHGNGTGDLLDALVAALPQDAGEPEEDDSVKVAIIGRPNAGKSSLTNKLLGEDRTIVSDVAGTTRDSIDSKVSRGERQYTLIDTAGIRRKSQIDEDVEYYGFVRALRAVDRADVAVLVIDSQIGLTDQDQRIARLSAEKGRALIVVLNKWDLLEDPDDKKALETLVADRLMFVGYAPMLRISALTGRSVEKIWSLIDKVYANYTQRISTSKLNTLLTEMRDFGHTLNKGGKRLRMHYMTQTKAAPPEFVVFANHPDMIDQNFTRYVENRMRTAFDLEGTPVKIKFRKKES